MPLSWRKRVFLLWIAADVLLVALSFEESDAGCRSDGVPFDLSGALLLVGLIDLVWTLVWWYKADQVHPLLGKAVYLAYTVSFIAILSIVVRDSDSTLCQTPYGLAVFWLVISSIRSAIELGRLWRQWKDLHKDAASSSNTYVPVTPLPTDIQVQ